MLTHCTVFAVAEDQALHDKIVKSLLSQNSDAKKRRVPKDSIRASLCLLVLTFVQDQSVYIRLIPCVV